MKKILRTMLVVLLLLELGYLLLMNLALYLPVTQVFVNKIRPEKFQVSWDQAWSWYPLRVHVTGLAVDGESRSQQWQLQAPNASASIALLPLLFKRVWISEVRATDIDYRQRPRLKPDKDYSALLPHFPDIGSRDVSAVAELSTKKKSPWYIAVDDIEATGQHHFWIFQMRGSVFGELAGGLTFETRGGPFSLDLPVVNLALQPVSLNGDYEVLRGGTLSGELGFAPFVPKENKGVALLSYLRTDVQADIAMNDLSFLDLFLLNLKGVAVNGKGRVTGRLRYDRGQVLPATNLAVDASELRVIGLSHVIGGAGEVTLAMDEPQLGQGLYLKFQYKGLTVHPEGGTSDLLTGEGLGLVVRGDGYVLPDKAASRASRSVELAIAGLAVPDLARLQGYLPPQLPLQVHGGQGTLNGKVYLAPSSLAVDLSLSSESADLALRNYRFNTDLAVVLKLDNPDISTEATTLDGSYLQLSDSQLQRMGGAGSAQWNTRFDIEQGYVSLNGDPATRAGGDAKDLLEELVDADASERLSRLWAQLQLSASMSSLEWIAALIGPGQQVDLAGSGNLRGTIHIEEGKAAPPSQLAVISDDLAVSVLDYISRGSGEVSLVVDQGHPQPIWSLSVALHDADLRRQSDEVSHIEDVQLELAAQMTTTDVDAKPVQATELDFRITSARVSDMAVFNSYLPQDGSVAFAGGTADLAADITLRQRDADGWLKLDSTGVKARVADQSVSGDLLLDVQLAAGIPKEMAFDISGSRLRLDNVRVTGERSAFQNEDWSAEFSLEHGQVVWRKPVRVRAEGALAISDSRPLVTMFENGGWRPDFISRMLTIKDIQGNASLSVADKVVYIENAQMLSDKLELGARGSLSAEGRDAMVYLRYKRLDGLIKYSGQDRNLDIINARETFDAFQPVPGEFQSQAATGN